MCNHVDLENEEPFEIIEKALADNDVGGLHYGSALTLSNLMGSDRNHLAIRNFSNKEVGLQIIRHLKEFVRS